MPTLCICVDIDADTNECIGANVDVEYYILSPLSLPHHSSLLSLFIYNSHLRLSTVSSSTTIENII